MNTEACDYIDGQFKSPTDVSGEWIQKSPADLSDTILHVQYSFEHVERSLEAAKKAFKTWRSLSLTERKSYLLRLEEVFKKKQSRIVEAISREVGKPSWEAQTEFQALLQKIKITCDEGYEHVAPVELKNISSGTDGFSRPKPHGVFLVLGPFNFPFHLPNGHIIPALLIGNTVVFKPSEKTPLSGRIYAECFHEAGFPAGVFNLVQGDKEVGRRLATHESVAGILFTGSYEVGLRIKQDTLQQHWKILALEMGGKNPSIVFSDAQLDHAVHETLFSSFVTAGQRCTATSRILVQESLVDTFVQRFHERSKAFTIGHWSKDPFMGPLIDSSSVDRYLKYVGIAQREGAQLVMRGKAFDTEKKGYFVTPTIAQFSSLTIEQTRKSIFIQSEIFAPAVSIQPFREPEEAIALANESQYGLASSVFTRSEAVFRKLFDELEYGIINWNKSTAGASSKLPFGGIKKSGNHFPTAVFATRYCSVSTASLEYAAGEFQTPIHPSLNWS